jgi:hypothetical protein
MTSLAITTWTTAGVNITASEKLQSEADIQTFHLSEGKTTVTALTLPNAGNRYAVVLTSETDYNCMCICLFSTIMIYVKYMELKHDNPVPESPTS